MTSATPLWSVVLIARNEAKTLTRMLQSLSEFRTRGGEVILVDTGSTDGTPDVARALGCRVEEKGSTFRSVIDFATAEEINSEFIMSGDSPILSEGDSLFDYARARNFAASLATNDFIAMPDCDEVYTRLDIDAINALLETGSEQLEYNFVFSHDEFGAEAIKFLHSKFYDRRKLKWVGIVHEVLSGEARRTTLDEKVIKLEHWQNPETNRAGYLPGLALDCYQNPENDRNLHYFARELFWHGRTRSAIAAFKRHIALGAWPAERAQSMIFIGDCYTKLGDESEGLNWYHKAFILDSSRREPLLRLAEHFWKKNDPEKVAAYCSAAITIPWNGFYCNHAAHYAQHPHELLYWALWYSGDKGGSKVHWEKAREFQPLNSKYLHDARFYLKLPRVSIVIPTLGREEKLARLLDLIKQNANYPDYEVIVERDSFESRQGVPKMLKAGVEKSTGELVMFLGNDCIPERDFLILAVLKMLSSFPDGSGLVGLNDGYWHGEFATHWLASKKLLPSLDSEFFHTGYRHCGCDNELTERCRAMNKYVWCSEAKVLHDHPVRTGFKPSDLDEVYRLAYDRQSMEFDRDLLAERGRLLGFEVRTSFAAPAGA